MAVNRLPPGVLRRILEYRNDGWDLIAAIHVCRYWHFAMTTSPSLKHIEIRPAEDCMRGLNNLLGQRAPSPHPIALNGVSPPNLTTISLSLPKDVSRFYLSSLLLSLSGCPQLRNLFLDLPCTTIQDVAPDQVVVLESVVELDYTCNTVCRVLPHLKLPSLKKLRVFSFFQAGQVNKLADSLPSEGHILLSKATSMIYISENTMEGLELSGEDTRVSISGFCPEERFVLTDWFFDESCIPFGRIERLDLGGLRSGSTFSLDRFKNLKSLQFPEESVQNFREVLSLLAPKPGAEIPCPSLEGLWFDSYYHPWPLVQSPIPLDAEVEEERHGLELAES